MDHDIFVPKGAATFAVDYTDPPKDFYFILLPHLTMLAFSSAIEPLRIANQISGKLLYRWYTFTPDGAPVRCSNNVTITPDSALQPIPKTARSFVCAGGEPNASLNTKTTNWVRRQQAHGATVGGICTGAFTLAAAGGLTGRRFTLHWENQPAFRETHADLLPTGNIFEIDGDLMTCGGGNAATDMILSIIESDHSKDLAVMVADMCLHARSFNTSVRQQSALSVALGTRNKRLIKTLELMDENIEDPLYISDLAAKVGLSSRQLERLFKRYLNDTPNEIYVGLRLSQAHALLSETNMSITEISIATGFSSSNQLSIRFRRRFGISPHSLRKQWKSKAGA